MEKLAWKIIKGGMIPADGYTAGRLREKGYHIGDIVHSNGLSKPRNPRFNRLVHAFGKLAVKNIECFSSLDPHGAIKRCQYEGDIECDHIIVNMGGVDHDARLPRSINFSSMDEGTFSELFKKMCRHISLHYWKDLTEEKIAEMAELMADE